MDKTNALERLSALEPEAAELRKIIDPPEPKPSLLTKPVPMSGDLYWHIDGSTRFLCAKATRAINYKTYNGVGNMFRTQELAQTYAEAIETMLLLRHQPGTLAASRNGAVRFYVHSNDSGTGLDVRSFSKASTQLALISPAFDSSASAMAAIETIGADRILKMFKTFHHVED